jgi:sterol desaturase/sphingolipid hydroxylase (fatty acid hydroxylase superfamily)
MNVIKRVFDRKGAPVLTAVFIALFIAEGRRALRKRKQVRSERVIVNSIVAIPSFGLLRFVFLPIMVKLAIKNHQLGWGLNDQYRAPRFIKAGIAFLIMDYTNYLWHILNHKIPLLWRFHLVHHSDRDLDVTTAFRFHFGELIGSVFYRGAFVFLSGATVMNVLLYEILFEAATQFHHSNRKLPFKLEEVLNKIIVTPRMHGIHHSQVRSETDSNYSVIFSFWDRIHSTARLNVAQETIVIGVPTYQNADELTPGYLLKLPFTKIKHWNGEGNMVDALQTNKNNVLAR